MPWPTVALSPGEGVGVGGGGGGGEGAGFGRGYTPSTLVNFRIQILQGHHSLRVSERQPVQQPLGLHVHEVYDI